MYKPENDGIDHINVYSKGKTQLGRGLSNFAYTPFRIPFLGSFNSVEGFWYWVLTNAESTRYTYGFTAKKLGKEILDLQFHGKEEVCPNQVSPRLLKIAYRAKLRCNPSIKQDLEWNTLPLAHYYVYGGKVVEPKEFRWTVELWSSLV